MQDQILNLSSQEIEALETRYRAAFINSLGGFKSVVMVGTVNKKGNENLAIFNSLIHIGANPALCAFIVRPDVSPRHTLENILETGYYTINHLLEDTYEQAHQSSARYPRESSEFDAVGLDTEYSKDFKAPYVKSSRVKFGCEFVQRINIEINGTSLIIGKIVEVLVPKDCVSVDGYVDIEKAGSITVSGLDSYHKTQKLARLTYAKTDKKPSKI